MQRGRAGKKPLYQPGTRPVPAIHHSTPLATRPAMHAAHPHLMISRLAARQHRALCGLHSHQLHPRLLLLQVAPSPCNVGGGGRRGGGDREHGSQQRQVAGRLLRQTLAHLEPLPGPANPPIHPPPKMPTCDGAASANPRHQEVHGPRGVPPDLGTRGLVVNLRVGCSRGAAAARKTQGARAAAGTEMCPPQQTKPACLWQQRSAPTRRGVRGCALAASSSAVLHGVRSAGGAAPGLSNCCSM